MGSVLGTLLPSIAVILSNVQLASPLMTAMTCRKQNDLGALNPVPWAVSFINCAGYMIYGCVIGNSYLMCSVTLGLPVNFFAVSTALRILGSKTISGKVQGDEFIVNGIKPIDFAWQVEMIVLGGLAIWILVAFIVGSVLPSAMNDPRSVSLNLVGNICCTTSILYYVSPLSVLLDIIRKRDAASIHGPLVTLNLVASTMWAAYGLFYMNDVNVYAPNMTAMAFSVTQLSIKAYFPSLRENKSLAYTEPEEGLSPMHSDTTHTKTPYDAHQSVACTNGVLKDSNTHSYENISRRRPSTEQHANSAISPIHNVEMRSWAGASSSAAGIEPVGRSTDIFTSES